MHPELIDFGNFKIASFGAAMVVAFLLSLMVASRRAERFGFTKQQVSDVAFVAIIAGILGARIFFIVQDLPYYLAHKEQLFSVQMQGLTSFGGFIFGGIAAAIWCKRKKLSVIGFLDLAGPAFVIGHAVGRIGCLLNGCCHGAAATVAFPFTVYSAEAKSQTVPAQLYDSLMNVIVFFVVLQLEKRSNKPGFTFGIVFVLHGLTRFIYEFFRAGSSSTTIGGLPFTEGHVMAVLVALFGLFFVLRPVKQAVVA
jgi:phosphatidylglycerol:prolipoprotein diacylglycerol transferase